jgi:hypothetical protein
MNFFGFPEVVLDHDAICAERPVHDLETDHSPELI